MEFIITSPEHENPREAYSFDLTYPDDPRDETVTFGGTKVGLDASALKVVHMPVWRPLVKYQGRCTLRRALHTVCDDKRDRWIAAKTFRPIAGELFASELPC